MSLLLLLSPSVFLNVIGIVANALTLNDTGDYLTLNDAGDVLLLGD